MTPLARPGGYRLVALTEADFQQMLADVDKLVADYDWQTWDSPYSLDDFKDYQLTLEREAWLHFPDPAAEWSTLAWDIARREILRGREQTQPAEYRFESLLQAALNTRQTTPDQMGEWLEGRGFTLTSLLPADNLKGDGQPGWVFQINISGDPWNPDGVFALVALANGGYHLTQVYPWMSLYHGWLRFEIVESTAIGRPGILLMDHIFGVGFATWEHSHLYLVAWQDSVQRFVNLAQNIPVLEMDEFIHVITNLDPPNWEVGPWDEQGTQTITATVEFYTSSGCPPPAYQTVYRWDGRQYQWAGEGFTDVDPAASRLCQVMWALYTGRADPQTIAILNAALEDGAGNYDQFWGPAGRDYLRLQLGFLYALSGQRQAALQELQAVQDQPEHPEFHMASDLARIFLRAYPSDEAFQACDEVVNYLNEALSAQATFGSVSGNLLHDSIIGLWGIDDPRWVWDGTSVCNVDAALQQSLQAANPQNTNQLVEWLNGSRIGWGPLARADLDGNGVEDWLAILQRVPGWADRWGVWVFLRDGQNIRTIPVTYIGNNPSSTTFQLLNPDPQGNPASFLYTGSDAQVFEIRPASADLPFVSDLPAKPVSLINGWLLDRVDDFEISEDDQTLSLYDQTYTGFYRPNDTMQAVLHWEGYAESYVVIERLPSPQEQVIRAAEQAILMNDQPVEAILPLQELLRGEIFEEVTEWSSDEGYNIGPPFRRTYIQYLLGLAYELSGDEANAVQTYWQLWHDYPDSPYAILAGRKLLLLQSGG